MKPKQNLIVINTWIIFHMCFVYNYKRYRNVCQSSNTDFLSLRQFFEPEFNCLILLFNNELKLKSILLL